MLKKFKGSGKTKRKIAPLPLKEFTEKMLRENPELPREQVVRGAKKAIQEEYESLLAILGIDREKLKRKGELAKMLKRVIAGR